ncbi:MAG: DNA-3-methyladenine glycosylase I [Capsulimonadaceae bacterium]
MSEIPMRCDWANGSTIMESYHDREWGVPIYEDRLLFEMLTLEGAQAGLSWMTVLRKRSGYRAAFADFDPAKVAGFTDDDANRIVETAEIVRNRAKVASTIGNARAFLRVQEEFGTFSKFQWEFVGGSPIVNRPRSMSELPASTELSDRFSKELKRRGFKFVGTTICYAYMQAVGMVDDHLETCFRGGSGG